ncbi:transcription initiation factor tfiid subunit [Anaeramoeba flamelloides]|uniref:Transcription initiation factor tfiid subunit n=1 Tax=Anaeramoeba flamelloides TaxID=1746091 RepID=A0AAV7Y9Z8_9EUKA|nr:transcription initiation factor tfiid subunit [Anaeramoeba flamelloides]
MLSPSVIIEISKKKEKIGKIDQSVALLLSREIEFRIRELLLDSLSFMRHSKRKALIPRDICNALKLRTRRMINNLPQTIPVRKISKKLLKGIKDQEQKQENLINNNNKNNNNSNDPNDLQTTHKNQEKILNVKKLLRSSLPSYPIVPTFRSHWLAIAGTMPKIPENVIVYNENLIDEQFYSVHQTNDFQDTNSNNKEKKNIKSKNKRFRKNSIQPVIQMNKQGAVKRTIGTKIGSKGTTEIAVEITPIMKHNITQELQFYYDRVIDIINGGNERKRYSVYNSLTEDTGIQQLAPYFIQHIQKEVKNNLKQLDVMMALMKMSQALIRNESVLLGLFLHQLVPSILTCILSSDLSSSQFDDHWKLRDFAAQTLSELCHKFDNYTSLKPRVINTLALSFVNKTKKLTTHYGAIVGLAALGLDVIRLILIPNAMNSLQILNPIIETEKKDTIKKIQAIKCRGMLLLAIGRVVMEQTEKRNSKRLITQKNDQNDDDDFVDVLKLYDMFGNALDCFIYSNSYHYTQVLI